MKTLSEKPPKQTLETEVIASLICAQKELEKALRFTALVPLIPPAVKNELSGMRDDLARMYGAPENSVIVPQP